MVQCEFCVCNHCIKQYRKSKENLTLHHMGKLFISYLSGIKFKIWRVTFFKSIFPFKNVGMSSGFRATDDLPRAHWDETEFSLSEQNIKSHKVFNARFWKNNTAERWETSMNRIKPLSACKYSCNSTVIWAKPTIIHKNRCEQAQSKVCLLFYILVGWNRMEWSILAHQGSNRCIFPPPPPPGLMSYIFFRLTT